MKFAKKTFLIGWVILTCNILSFSTLKQGAKLIPFSLIGVDQKTVTVFMEDGKLTLITEYVENGEKVIKKTNPDTILIDFWATWCVPCRKAMPSMQKLHDMYVPKQDQEQGGLGLFGIALDGKGSRIVKPFYDRLKFTYPMLCDPTKGPNDKEMIRTAKDMKSKYKVQGIPVVYLIDAEGIIQHVHVGFKEKDFEKLDNMIKEIISGESE